MPSVRIVKHPMTGQIGELTDNALLWGSDRIELICIAAKKFLLIAL